MHRINAINKMRLIITYSVLVMISHYSRNY